MIGLSWLGVLDTDNLPALSMLSQAQPLPKRVAPALAKSSLNLSKPPSSLEMALASAPVGCPPAFGPIVSQNKEWLAWPPPLLRTAVRALSGTASRLASRSSIDLLCRAAW